MLSIWGVGRWGSRGLAPLAIGDPGGAERHNLQSEAAAAARFGGCGFPHPYPALTPSPTYFHYSLILYDSQAQFSENSVNMGGEGLNQPINRLYAKFEMLRSFSANSKIPVSEHLQLAGNDKAAAQPSDHAKLKNAAGKCRRQISKFARRKGA